MFEKGGVPMFDIHRPNVCEIPGRPVNDGSSPTSTTYSALSKLMRSGDITKTDEAFELADPFFRRWVLAFTS